MLNINKFINVVYSQHYILFFLNNIMCNVELKERVIENYIKSALKRKNCNYYGRRPREWKNERKD